MFYYLFLVVLLEAVFTTTQAELIPSFGSKYGIDKRGKQLVYTYPYKCKLPFTYQSKTYYSCTKDGHPRGKSWCNTDHKVWSWWQTIRVGICINEDNDKIKTFGGNTCNRMNECVFPFVYKGKTYHGCTKDHAENYWCMTSLEKYQWGYCNAVDTYENLNGVYDSSLKSATGIPATFPYRFRTKFNPHRWYDFSQDPNYCHFPYRFGGQLYMQCIDSPWWGYWCSTTIDYDTDKKWKLCTDHDILLPATDQRNPKCSFPFVKDGKQRVSCWLEGGDFTCSTTANYDRDRQTDLCYEHLPLPSLALP